jgi:hypothetical protein
MNLVSLPPSLATGAAPPRQNPPRSHRHHPFTVSPPRAPPPLLKVQDLLWPPRASITAAPDSAALVVPSVSLGRETVEESGPIVGPERQHDHLAADSRAGFGPSATSDFYSSFEFFSILEM